MVVRLYFLMCFSLGFFLEIDFKLRFIVYKQLSWKMMLEILLGEQGIEEIEFMLVINMKGLDQGKCRVSENRVI